MPSKPYREEDILAPIQSLEEIARQANADREKVIRIYRRRFGAEPINRENSTMAVN